MARGSQATRNSRQSLLVTCPQVALRADNSESLQADQSRQPRSKDSHSDTNNTSPVAMTVRTGDQSLPPRTELAIIAVENSPGNDIALIANRCATVIRSIAISACANRNNVTVFANGSFLILQGRRVTENVMTHTTLWLNPILGRRWNQLVAVSVIKTLRISSLNLVYDSCFGTIKFPKVQIGT